jgi:hypothetical protein
MSMSRNTNAGAYGLAKLGFKSQTPSNATAIAGATFDRQSYNWALSLEVFHNFCYTAASGDATGIITVLTQIYHGDASNMSDEAVLKTKSVAITWVSDAAKEFFVSLPADLSAAKRYVRAKFTETKAGTITVSTPIVSQAVRFSGFQTIPHSSFLDAGYFTSTDTAV